MSVYSDQLAEAADDLMSGDFTSRDGRVVPDSNSVSKTEAVRLDGCFLYADLAGSSKLAEACPWSTTAKIIRAYLEIATRLIRVWQGEVRSFDGDRVMGVFAGDGKTTSAVNCAREIDWCVQHILNPKAKAKFKSITDNNISIRHCVGVAVGEARAVRAGIRDNNDLIWIGRAPSFAAKLSDVRAYPYEVYISMQTYNQMSADLRNELISPGVSIWQKVSFQFAGADFNVYRTRTTQQP
jgi:adenylate cyclase